MTEANDGGALLALVTEIRVLGAMIDGLPAPEVAPPAIAEDLTVIAMQTRNALATLERLQELVPRGPSAELDALLHRMNNHFTGVASLATLCRDDVRGAPDLSARLAEVEQQARRAADCVRALARSRS
ncbi:MAG: hypothetical protein A2138_25860 [Deltaproteobacteria bacterium RBG_16_71_12]|nr:MAG: hypothetical protein A2138_25860 [Deltaproteobacteria bacterium RBG_16_71_12]